MSKQDIKIDSSSLPNIISDIPKEDFIDAQFDVNNNSPVKDVLILFSTPRSGSTLLTDLLQTNNLCLPHEYFQPFKYLPILAERWGCIENNHLNKISFLESLIKFRTYPNGWLGINVHGEHLAIFSKFDDLFPAVNKHYIHLQRQNIIPQAVSYEIAVQTNQWSSKYKSKAEANYNYTAIENKLHRIQRQNALISSYILSRNISCETIYYEDIIAEPLAILKNIIPENIIPDFSPNTISAKSSMKKQSSERNKNWTDRFSHEYFENINKNKFAQSVKFCKDSSKYIIKKGLSQK